MRRAAVIATLAWFGFQTVTALREHGYAGFFALAQANSATNLQLLDVTIFVVLASV